MIDYQLLAKACAHYTQRGYVQTEVPWLVERGIDDITRPRNTMPFTVDELNLRLIASGEHGFLSEYITGTLPHGKLFTVTPCFRSDEPDLLHQRQFMKLELGIAVNSCDAAEDMANLLFFDALNFFNSILYSNAKYLMIVKTYAGCDIVLQTPSNEQVELGSYGYRSLSPTLQWVYGTGLALPRFTTALSLMEEK